MPSGTLERDSAASRSPFANAFGDSPNVAGELRALVSHSWPRLHGLLATLSPDNRSVAGRTDRWVFMIDGISSPALLHLRSIESVDLTDDAGWRRVLAVRPDLAPATQPPHGRVAHGMARGDGDTLSRSDQLHVLGNGVVPAQAAYALTILTEELGVWL